MKSTLRPLALFLTFAAHVMAGEAVPNTAKEPYTGRIMFVSEAKVSVKAKGVENSTVFKLGADTRVTLNGQVKVVTELKKGWKVVVTPKADDPSTAAAVAVNTSPPAEVEKQPE